MKKNYEMSVEELGYSKAYMALIFDHLGLVNDMEKNCQDYEEQGFRTIRLYAYHKLSQMSVHKLIQNMLEAIATLEMYDRNN